MILNDIHDLPAAEERAVIINANTKVYTTLALLSALRYTGMPVLLIDCRSNDGSWEHFTGLMRRQAFDLLARPLQRHGAMLDWLFGNLKADKVLLIDSDLEILNGESLVFMRHFIAQPRTFGSGFVHGPTWLTTHPGAGYYQERMWIPFALLRTNYVREALQAGYTFLESMVYNDFAPWPWLARQLHKRFRNPRWANWKLTCLNPFKTSFHGLKPCYVYCDTGADVFQYLKYRRDLYYAGFPAHLAGKYATHLHGITRVALNPGQTNTVRPEEVIAPVRQRLNQEYGMTFPEAPQGGVRI
jgi:hypothetical protein